MIYLASESPRRHELLNQIQVDHLVLKVPKPEGEDEPRLPNEAPPDYVKRTAKEKAFNAQAYLRTQALEEHPILCADTCVMMGDTIVDKAHNANDVIQSLRQLSGQTHEVHTHVVLLYKEHCVEKTSISQVTLRTLSEEDILFYASSHEGVGKAGGYAIQGLGGILIETITGSYSGIMGLPVMETWQLLEQLRHAE